MPLLRLGAYRGQLLHRSSPPDQRDGDFSIGNILVCHLRCNKIKGNLTSHEFFHLSAFLAHFPPEVGKDVLARLYAAAASCDANNRRPINRNRRICLTTQHSAAMIMVSG
jgi:hypothetical protein